MQRRCATADDVALWVKEVYAKATKSTKATNTAYAEITSNAVLVLINVACALLDRQIEAQAAAP